MFGPWLWKEAKIKEEKVKCELRGRHSDCYWVEVRKRAEKMERSKEKQVVGMRRSRMTDQQGRRIMDNSASRKKPPLDALEHRARRKERQAGEARKHGSS
jgi:hypothetical protein